MNDLAYSAMERVLNEIDVVKQHNVFTFVPVAECYSYAGKAPIGTRRVAINKSDEAAPDYKSRCVVDHFECSTSRTVCMLLSGVGNEESRRMVLQVCAGGL